MLEKSIYTVISPESYLMIMHKEEQVSNELLKRAVEVTPLGAQSPLVGVGQGTAMGQRRPHPVGQELGRPSAGAAAGERGGGIVASAGARAPREPHPRQFVEGIRARHSTPELTT